MPLPSYYAHRQATEQAQSLRVPVGATTPVLAPVASAGQGIAVTAMPKPIAVQTSFPPGTGTIQRKAPVVPAQQAFQTPSTPATSSAAVAQALNAAATSGQVLSPSWFDAGTIADAQQAAVASQQVVPGTVPLYGAPAAAGALGWKTWLALALGAAVVFGGRKVRVEV